MKKNLVLAPGPTQVPPEVLAASAKPTIHHRTPQFEAIFADTAERLQRVFQTQSPVITFASSGTGSMESSVVNLLSPGDTAITIEGGKFGERWGQLCEAYGVKRVPITLEYGDVVDPAQVEEALKANPGTKAVYATLCETSTGVLSPIPALGKIVSKTDAVLVVDAISGLAADELRADEWGVDVVIGGSQKALMLPPGLAFCSISEKAQALMASSKCPKYYFSWEKALKALADKSTAFTPAVNLTYALQASLDMILAEGMESVWARHARLASALQAAIKAIGLAMFSKAPSNTVTAVKVPDGVDGGKIPKIMRDTHGVTIAGGQGSMKGKIFRFAALGWCNEFDVTTALSALELTLTELGFQVAPGKAVGAAIAAFEG
ncbi:alanine--glyoxylate aminotransferase family protein [Candidatus Sumerlaeota bacterium]|nr:alanine--glyoxylate aminotransferase family protein [Candidatus Sumerlaeota bacterium]